jgi:hypothetical protein
VERLGRGVDGVSKETTMDKILERQIQAIRSDMSNPFITANRKSVAAQLPCSLEEFLVA